MTSRSSWFSLLLITVTLGAVTASTSLAQDETPWPERPAEDLAGLSLRHLGPALMSGRIADIAIHPEHRSTWYIAVGSGGVWKTTNAGTTIEPIFDGATSPSGGSYSVGDVTLDPNAPDVVWVGTGENVSGRHVGYGDGVYRSMNGGASWEHMGLTDSEHVSRIVVDPRDSNVVFVAAEGPLWSNGGDRGVFKSDDRGATWRNVLEISNKTGVADLQMDPKNPDVMYAAAYQRRRTVWSLLAGGPESGIYKSTDGGETWREVTVGLPSGDMGKIGLAISPFDSKVVYATIEAKPESAGFYRSVDAGESWEHRNSYHSGGTGPHYYQEIYASPHSDGRVYQMDVFIHVTEDGGGSFRRVDGGEDKHSDNHALAFWPDDPSYLLAGTDAGVYESFDAGVTWKYVTNLPVTQIYKGAVDNDFPAYNIIGGTQDNGTIYGPVRTFNQHGVRDQDWTVPYGADGYDTAIDPENPDIVYVSWQMGHPLRFDRATGELTEIQPQPEPGDPVDRFNWDAPLLISPHDPARLYYGSQRVFRSNDRGDSWSPVSGDLTRGTTRYEMKTDGKVRSVDALWGNSAMSWYATLTSITESPLVEGLLYTGSDDGSIHISEDGGANWRRAELPRSVPERAFVNQVRASLHDADTVFAVLDNHKEGDYQPYLLVSRDRGRRWQSLKGDLPDRQILWAIAQDHVSANLLFVGAERGVYVSLDAGEHWRLVAGSPKIPFRDLDIQRRENDLVASSFARGFYVLDDYTPLRALAEGEASGTTLFAPRRALWFHPTLLLQNRGKGAKGTDYWAAENPPYGAIFTYYLEDSVVSRGDARRAAEGELDDGADVPLPSLDELRAENDEAATRVLLIVRDDEGREVRRVEGPTSEGIHRVAWDLRYPSFEPVVLELPTDLPPWFDPPVGPMAPPGRYTVELVRVGPGGLETLAAAVPFDVEAIFEPALGEQDAEDVLTLQQETGRLYQRALGVAQETGRALDRLAHLEHAVVQGPAVELALLEQVESLRTAARALQRELWGDDVLSFLQEPSSPSLLGRLQTVIGGHWSSRHGPTQTHRRNVEVVREALPDVLERAEALLFERLPALEASVDAAGGRRTPGRRPEEQ
ncbi:MAG: glycosyl hydrolase [Acidobacteriota bacterium]